MNLRLFFSICLLLAGCLVTRSQPVATQASAPPALPPLTAVKSPVEMFREMLAAPPAKLERDLSNRPPAVRARLLAKLKEYQALPAEERELRLQITQLRWNLLRLLPLPPEQRTELLAAMKPADRKLVADRLEQWDQLSPAVRQEVLKYEKTLEQFAVQTNAMASVNAENGAPPAPPPKPLPDMGNFLKLPVEQRRQVYTSFERFFQLSADERQRTIASLSPPMPPEASNSLRSFENLSANQRSQYLAAMRQFSAMTESGRQEFLRNAARWKELTPAERQAWRSLVNHLPPAAPLPQEIAFSLAPPPLPPSPAIIPATFHGSTNLAH